MNILILEDEKAAAIRLQQLLKEVVPVAAVTGVLESVKESVAWLRDSPAPDVILSDIQLADGLSFDIFRQLNITVPVIFTTAFDVYTLNAFKLNSIDYLLKPIDKDELKAAFDKYQSLQAQHIGLSRQVLDLFHNMASGKTNYKSRFLIKQGDRLLTVHTDEMAYVRADDKVVFLYTQKGQRYIIDDTLDELENVLDPSLFFRINRTYIAPLVTIDKIHNHFNGRLKVSLRGATDDDIFVSRARAATFKKWLGQ